MKKKVFSLMMMLLLAFFSVARAQESLPYAYGFENGIGGWTMSNCHSSSGVTTSFSSYCHEGTAAFCFYYTTNPPQYLISPEMVGATGGLEVSFWYRDYSSYYEETFQVGYSTTTNAVSAFTFEDEITGTTEWVQYTNTFPAGTKYVALKCTSYDQFRLFVDDFTFANAGGGGGSVGDQLHVKYMDGQVEVVDELNLGVRPADAWMEPFNFTMYTEGATYTVNVLDFTPSDGMFTVDGEELPFQVVRDNDVDLNMMTNGTEAGVIERQFVAITEGDRAAHIWPVTVELYAPEIPDVWEKACDEATTFPFVEVPANAHHTVLHNDYTLPFPEIREGVDAVYKLVFDHDQMLNAEVTVGENGKVALYREGFEGEGGPMATNYYTGTEIFGGGGAAAAPYEIQLGNGTSTTGYLPMYYLYDNSLSTQLYLGTELAEAGATTATMNSISWYSESTYAHSIQNISIWMANVTDAQVSSTSPLGSTMTLVYQGNFQEVVGWNEFVFNAGNFAWDGQSNVLVMTQMNNGEWGSTIQWACGNVGFSAGSYTYRDNTAYDANTTSYTMSTTTNRANTVFKAGNRNAARRNVVPTACVDPSVMDVAPARDGWLAYDDGNYATSIGNSTAYDWTWGVMYPASMLGSNNTLTKVAIFNTGYNVEDITIDIYQGGTTAPGTLVASKVVTPVEGLQEVTLNSPVTINPSQNLWITLSEYGTYVLTGCNTTEPNNQWVENDGWYHIGDLASTLAGYGWMIRAYVEDNAVPPTPPTPPTPTPGEVSYSAGPVIENLPVVAGTYYLVASSTDPDFEVTINAEEMPCPTVEEFAFQPQPADDEDEVEPASVTLRWMIPEYATGWRLVFGSTYHPEQGHPQTIIYPEDGSFTRDMANSYTVHNLWNNTNYFWHVEFNNDGCPDGVSSPIWGFTTHLNVPQNLRAVDETVFNDEQIVLNWNAVVDRTYRMYNVYRDGQLIGHTQVNNIGNTTYTDEAQPYNMDGYTYYVTAVYDEGESAPSNTVNVKVSGRGNVNGHVYEQDGTTGIAGATVTMVGPDEFGVNHTYNFTTDAQGYYSGAVYAGPTYDGQAAKDGYQTDYVPEQGEPIVIVYSQTTSPIDYILDENFDPVCSVIAEYYPDSLDPQSPYVKVYWGCGLPGEEIVEDFETGDFSKYDWQIDPTYPWSITTSNPYEGTYCMKSGGAGVASVTSNMTITVDIPADGDMSFFARISSENNYDYGHFYIDGVEKYQASGAGNWVEKTYPVTQGTHTFQWRYTKDSSVNTNDDCFYVDYITFYRRPEPAIPGTTYDFEDGTMQGWTSIDADGDGYGWYMGSEIMTGQPGNDGSSDFVLSQSYYGGVILYPDNYLVSPQVQLGGIVRFYACAQDAAYPSEHFGLAVSTTGTNPSDFTMLQEWTMTAKNAGGSPKTVKADPTAETPQMGHSREGNSRAQGNWYEYTVDLSAYSGMGYVAIRHFDCHDMFYLNVDDITIGEPGKAMPNNDRAFAYYRVYRTNCYNDGPYTLLDEDHPDGNTVVLSCELHDTIYIDVDWPDVAPGVYKWGVGCVYIGNRGEEIAGPIHWAAPVAVDNNCRVFEGTRAPENNYKPVSSTDAIAGYKPSRGNATVILTAGDVWGDGSGYQMLLDADATAYGTTIPETGALSTSCSGNDAIYAEFEYKIPTNADGNCSTNNIVINNSVSIEIPAGTYDWCITNPTPGDRIWIAASTGNVGGREDNYLFEEGNIYEFVMSMHGSNDGVDVTITSNPNPPTPPTPPTPTPGSGDLQEPRESEIVWSSNCLDKDMWLGENAVDITVLLNSADSPEGVTVSFVNLNEDEQELYPVADVVLDETGYYAWETFRKGNYEITITNDGYETIVENVDLWNPASLRYVMIEIIYGVSDLYVSRTGWAMWEGHGDPLTPGPGPGPGPGPQPGQNATVILTVGDVWGDGTGYQMLLDETHSLFGSTIPETGALSTNCSGNEAIYAQFSHKIPTNADGNCSTQNIVLNNSVSIEIPAGTYDWCITNPTPGDRIWIAAANGNVGGRQDDYVFEAGRTYEFTCQMFGSNDGVNVTISGGAKNMNAPMAAGEVKDIANVTPGNYGYVVLPEESSNTRHLEYYKVMCESIDHEPIFNINTPYNFCQVATDELVEGELYICKVAAVYSTGMSEYAECVWEYESCENYAGTVNGLEVNGTTVTWDYPGTPGPGPGPGPQPGENATVILTAGDVWGDGSGYQMLLDADANAYGATLPETGALSTNCSGNEAIYAEFEYKIPTNADGNCSTSNIVINNSVSIEIPAGTYDWCITNPTPGDRIWIAAANGNVGGRQDNYVFEAGRTYEFTCQMFGSNDGVNVTISGGAKNMYAPLPAGEVKDIANVVPVSGNRAPWDLMFTFEAPEGAHYGVVTDGTNFYTSNWGYSSAAHNFYKYDMQGNMLEGFEISGCGTLRGMTYDGTYFYGVANSSTVYCVDLANHSVVSTFTTSYGAMRGITYDPTRDGFWVIGNWSGNLTLIDRTGAIVQVGPEPTSASDLAYYKDENDVEHVFCFNNADNGVYDYNITNNQLGGSVFNFSNVPGFNAGSSGGCHVAAVNGKMAFIGDIQQSPNLIGVYELRDAGTPGPGPGPTPSGDILGAMVFLNGEWEAFVEAPTNTYTFDEAGEYCVRIVYNGTNELPSNNFYYAMSCEECAGNTPGTCEAGDPIHAEVLGATDQVRIWWGTEPTPPGASGWLTYGIDEPETVTIVGAGQGVPMSWGMRVPVSALGEYVNSHLTKVRFFQVDESGFSATQHGDVTANIYLGGTTPQGTPASSKTFNVPSNAFEWMDIELDNSVLIDGTQDLWVTFHSDCVTCSHPAAGMDDIAGTPDNRWAELGGQWDDLANLGLTGTMWLIQAYVDGGAKGSERLITLSGDQSAIAPAYSGNLTLNAAETVTPVMRNRASIVKYNVYRSDDANGTYVQIGEVLEAGQTLYEYFDTPATAGTYFYQVTAVYDDGCESLPALAADDPTHNYVSANVDAIGENSDMVALYPNPTKGNVTIEANGMSRITVVSVLGQVIFDTELNANVYTLNMSQFNAGMYMVRIYTENGVTVKRVTVMQ